MGKTVFEQVGLSGAVRVKRTEWNYVLEPVVALDKKNWEEEGKRAKYISKGWGGGGRAKLCITCYDFWKLGWGWSEVGLGDWGRWDREGWVTQRGGA